jgi:hypothetical protein
MWDRPQKWRKLKKQQYTKQVKRGSTTPTRTARATLQGSSTQYKTQTNLLEKNVRSFHTGPHQRSNEAKNIRDQTDQELKQRFGFISDPAKKQWWNIKQAIRSLDLRLLMIAPRNKTYHNLCENLRPPPAHANSWGSALSSVLK